MVKSQFMQLNFRESLQYCFRFIIMSDPNKVKKYLNQLNMTQQ